MTDLSFVIISVLNSGRLKKMRMCAGSGTRKIQDTVYIKESYILNLLTFTIHKQQINGCSPKTYKNACIHTYEIYKDMYII